MCIEKEKKRRTVHNNRITLLYFTKIYKSNFSSTVITIYLQPIDPERVKEVVEREREKKNS